MNLIAHIASNFAIDVKKAGLVPSIFLRPQTFVLSLYPQVLGHHRPDGIPDATAFPSISRIQLI